jgi:SulP family sulfate permease
LLVPGLSLAFIGLVQGAGISSSFPDDEGNYPDASRDFVGQGAANVASGFFQGMPVGGSMSASSLVKAAGARTRLALIIAALVMAVVVVVFGSVVGYIAMPALAGLLMTVGYRTVKPDQIVAVWKTGRMQAMVMAVTFVLTMIIPLQNAVLVGVGISMILYIIEQSNAVTVKRWTPDGSGNLKEGEPPTTVAAHEVIVLQPYGSLFFAAAPVFEELLPDVDDATQRSVVILRLRGRADVGSTFMEVLRRYAQELSEADSKLVVISTDDQVLAQLAVSKVTDFVAPEDIYRSDEWVGRTLKRAYSDALTWVGVESGVGDDED